MGNSLRKRSKQLPAFSVADSDFGIDARESELGAEHVHGYSEDFPVVTFQTFPQLVKRVRPDFHGWYTDSAEGGLVSYTQDSDPDRVIALVKKMSHLLRSGKQLSKK